MGIVLYCQYSVCLSVSDRPLFSALLCLRMCILSFRSLFSTGLFLTFHSVGFKNVSKNSKLCLHQSYIKFLHSLCDRAVAFSLFCLGQICLEILHCLYHRPVFCLRRSYIQLLPSVCDSQAISFHVMFPPDRYSISTSCLRNFCSRLLILSATSVFSDSTSCLRQTCVYILHSVCENPIFNSASVSDRPACSS